LYPRSLKKPILIDLTTGLKERGRLASDRFAR
jgi:hypothetical protein